jgi:signal transduction histidine kinase
VCSSDLETELHQAQRLKAMGEISAGIAHEINTPIQFVTDNMRFLSKATQDLLVYLSLATDAIKECESQAAGRDCLARLRAAEKKLNLLFLQEEIASAVKQSLEGLEQVAGIAHAMHDLAHMGTPGKPSPADINTVVRSAATVARNEWKHVAEMTFDLDPSLPPVPCYRGDVSQVLLNLITNAAHAIRAVVGNSGRKGAITLSTRGDGKDAVISVRDTGTGIPEVIRSRIFEPFFTTKEAGEGSGQGLGIARSLIVKKHGGALTLETEVGKGTVFIVRLPLRGGPSEQELR